VGFLRRSGVRQFSLQPWYGPPAGSHEPDGTTTAELFEVFTQSTERGRTLSARLVPALERDATELAGIAHLFPELYRAELARIVGRHGGSGTEADKLARLGLRECGPADLTGHGPVPVRAARVALFLRQECTIGPGVTVGPGVPG
jgi:hypothetical protein